MPATRAPSDGERRDRVADAMVTVPKTLAADATVDAVREFFRDGHVHMALVTDGSRLLSALVRDDLASTTPGEQPARELGTLGGRLVAPDADLETVLAQMRGAGIRRLAVTDPTGTLLGLLCLKQSGLGFCSDADVAARAAAPRD